MQSRSFCLVIATSLALCSCAGPKSAVRNYPALYAKVIKGMTEADVISALGKPDDQSSTTIPGKDLKMTSFTYQQFSPVIMLSVAFKNGVVTWKGLADESGTKMSESLR